MRVTVPVKPLFVTMPFVDTGTWELFVDHIRVCPAGKVSAIVYVCGVLPQTAFAPLINCIGEP